MDNPSWSQTLVQAAWVHLPLRARYLSSSLTLKLVDGHYLAAWPPVAALASPLALLVGFVIGWQHWGFVTVFSESIPVMVLAVGLGVLSGHLGVLFVVGFAVGDFFLGPVGWTPFVALRIPLLIEYGLLALVATSVPVLTKTLLAQLALPDAVPRPLRFGFAVVGHVALTCAMVYLWIQVVPILIRPIFTWSGYAPPVRAMAPLQEGGMVLVYVAALASLGRMALQGVTAFRATEGARLDALEAQLAEAAPVQSWPERLPMPVRIAGRTIWAVLLLAGMLQFWIDALLLAVLIFVLHAARERLFPVPLGPWPRWVERVPMLLRVLVGFVLVYYTSQAVLAQQMRATDTFRPIVLLVGLSLVIFFLLTPGLPKAPSSSVEEQEVAA